MPAKTHKTAAVLIPPESVWPPIQRIRRVRDRQFRRWMPHVTLLYPFRPPGQFDQLAPALRDACRRVEPFELVLAELRWFAHGRKSYTIWLALQPAERLERLHAELLGAVPDCDDTAGFAGGFTPHLSVGQVRGRDRLEHAMAELCAEWKPVRFSASRVSLIRRGDPPDDVFRVDRDVPLGG